MPLLRTHSATGRATFQRPGAVSHFTADLHKWIRTTSAEKGTVQSVVKVAEPAGGEGSKVKGGGAEPRVGGKRASAPGPDKKPCWNAEKSVGLGRWRAVELVVGKQSSLGDGRSRQGQSSVESRQSSAGDGAHRTAGNGARRTARVEQATSRSEQTALSRSSDAEE